MGADEAETLTVGHHVEQPTTPVQLPVIEVLTGRGFITGKSGAGKSNTASVLLEGLLEANLPCVILDADGEYYGLKEAYELLHVGADEECDLQVGPEHADELARLALEENVPIIVDVSGYLDQTVASDLVRDVAHHLFVKEKKLKKPFLLVVEEVHEYIPEGGGLDEAGQMLIKIGKRGRKHGLGLLGISQRPADVKKDFITQANWLVWHRLTWDNDTRVASRVVGSDVADALPDLEDGEAFLQTDWAADERRRIQFRRKDTFDAGATPGLDDVDRPELKSVDETLLATLADQTSDESGHDRIADLEAQLEQKDARIEELESKLEHARAVSDAAEQLAAAVATTDTDAHVQTRLDELEAQLETTADRVEQLLSATEPDESTEPLSAAVDAGLAEADETQPVTSLVDLWSTTRQAGPAAQSGSVEQLTTPPECEAVDRAIAAGTCSDETAWAVLEELTQAAMTPDQLAAAVNEPIHHIWTFLDSLRTAPFLERDPDGHYRIDWDAVE